jgi:hypothetical protein
VVEVDKVTVAPEHAKTPPAAETYHTTAVFLLVLFLFGLRNELEDAGKIYAKRRI